MSVLCYNGVVLPYAHVTNFSQEAVYDEMGGTDWYLTKFNISVQTILNIKYLATIFPVYPIFNGAPIVFNNAADLMVYLRNELLQPRRRLSFKFNDFELIPQNNQPGQVDSKNGPQPQSCVINPLTSETFMVTYTIVANYWERSGGSSSLTTGGALPGTGNCILYNRWTETIDIDKFNLTTRTREGKFIIRSDNDNGFIADQLRSQMAVVGIPAGFVRQYSRYTVSPDGLGISYSIADKEVYKLPPTPAYEAEGEYTETSAFYGATRICECRVALTGDKSSAVQQSQEELLRIAILIAITKLKIVIGVNANGSLRSGVIESAAFKVDMYQNKVEVRVKSMKVLDKTQMDTQYNGISLFTDIDYKTVAKTPGSEAFTAKFVPDPFPLPDSPIHRDRGTDTKRMLRAAAYFDPSISNTALNRQTGQLTKGTEVGKAGSLPGDSKRMSLPLPPYGNIQSSQPSFTPPFDSGTGSNPDSGTEAGPAAQIQHGDVVIGPGAVYTGVGSQGSVFTDYQIKGRFESDKHIYMVPITSPDGFQNASVAFVRLASPTLLYIVDWTALKIMEQPEIPNPTPPSNSNWILMDEIYEPASIVVTGEGGISNAVYRISGTFVYGNRTPNIVPVQDIIFGRPPFLNDVFPTGRGMPITKLTDQLIF